MLQYLNKNAQKAYREISAIVNNPSFLFSNDPALTKLEGSYNYCYIRGFNRLIQYNRITNERLLEALLFVEKSIESYLKEFYKNKRFIYYLNADCLVPAFTITVVSYYKEEDYKQFMELLSLINWYREQSCFNVITIVESNEGEEVEETIEAEEVYSTRTYAKVIET